MTAPSPTPSARRSSPSAHARSVSPTPWPSWRRVALSGAVALSASLAACSLIVTRGATQCASDGDCAGFGAGAKCTAEKVCRVADASSDQATVDAKPACTTNRQCIDASGGEPAICRKDTRVCVKLVNPDCPRVVAVAASGDVVTDRRAVEDDATIVLGSLTSLVGANQLKGEARVNAFELAVQEFATRGGVPVGDKTRPVAFVSCNDIDLVQPDGGDDPAGVRAARHLVATVGVPAIIGGGNSGTTTAALKETTLKGTLLIAPSATSPALTNNPDKGGLFFRTAPSDALQAIPLVQLVNEVEAGITTPADLRLSLFSKGDSYGQGLRDQIVEKLTFNGRKLSDPGNADYYRGLEYKTDAGFDFAAFVTATLAYKPHIIVIAGTNETVDGLIKPIEAGWTGGQPPPVYVLSDGLKADKLILAIKDDDAAATPKGLRTRVRGTAPGRRNSVTDKFILRYNARFPAEASAATTFGTAGAYDAAYLLLYGLGYVTDGTPTGANMAAGIRKATRVVPASVVEVGPAGIDVAAPLVRAGGDFDLNGASSPLEFDEAGESPADIEVWCVQKGTGGGSPTFFSTDKYYNAATKMVVGSFVCP
ncbi:MAG TPA: ABC transporter substrate-binding protein [Polyangiaceae bacterium]|nr:ABC transporter substrate-binding protein [Polyangiaceae bacterium]